MADIREKAVSVLNQVRETLDKNGFNQVETNSDDVFAFQSEKGTIKITYEDDKIYLLSADDSYENATEDSYKRIALSLLDESSTDKDIEYIAKDFSETIDDKYTNKAVVRKNNYKTPPTVSKAAVRGGQSYDVNTLANRIAQVYPDLKPYYKEMGAGYSEFLGEEFFTKYANRYIIDTIRANNPQSMKKLFGTLNEVFDDGSNDVQDVIAVTILGELNNDQILLANCLDYMNESMTPVVLCVNKFLASSSGKKAKKKLLNPPPYKPKKQKKKGFMSQLMDMQPPQ